MFNLSKANIAIWNMKLKLDMEEHDWATWLCGVCKLYFLFRYICVLLKEFLSEGESKSTRCDDLASLKSRNCPLDRIEDPRGSVVAVKNVTVTNRKKGVSEKVKPEQITQIQPQKLTMTLRSGKYPAWAALEWCYNRWSNFSMNVTCGNVLNTLFSAQVNPRHLSWNSSVLKITPLTSTILWTSPSPWKTIWKMSRTSALTSWGKCRRLPQILELVRKNLTRTAELNCNVHKQTHTHSKIN